MFRKKADTAGSPNTLYEAFKNSRIPEGYEPHVALSAAATAAGLAAPVVGSVVGAAHDRGSGLANGAFRGAGAAAGAFLGDQLLGGLTHITTGNPGLALIARLAGIGGGGYLGYRGARAVTKTLEEKIEEAAEKQRQTKAASALLNGSQRQNLVANASRVPKGGDLLAETYAGRPSFTQPENLAQSTAPTQVGGGFMGNTRGLMSSVGSELKRMGAAGANYSLPGTQTPSAAGEEGSGLNFNVAPYWDKIREFAGINKDDLVGQGLLGAGLAAPILGGLAGGVGKAGILAGAARGLGAAGGGALGYWGGGALKDWLGQQDFMKDVAPGTQSALGILAQLLPTAIGAYGGYKATEAMTESDEEEAETRRRRARFAV